MSRLRSLTNLLADVREVADVEGMTARHPDAFITKCINRAIAKFVDIVADSGQDYNTTKSSFSTVAGTSDYTSSSAMPTDYYKTRGVDLYINASEPINVRRYNFDERNIYKVQGNWDPGMSIAYRVVGSTLRLLPAPNGVYTVDHHYYITAPRLATGSETFDCINGHGEEWIVYSCAIEIGLRDEEDVRAKEAERDRSYLAFLESISSRDLTEPEHVREVVSRYRTWRGGRR